MRNVRCSGRLACVLAAVLMLSNLPLTSCGGTGTKTSSQTPATSSPAPGASNPAPGAHSVTLNWNASGSAGILGYNVYRGGQSGGPYAKVNAGLLANSDYLDTSVLAGQTYFYVVTAVSAAAESGFSAEVKAAVPAP